LGLGNHKRKYEMAAEEKKQKVSTPRLYRVWRHTKGDESMHEIVVVASSPEEAKSNALAHVKATNLGKSGRTQDESKALTKVLSVKRVGHKTCLEISKVPVAAIRAIKDKSVV
jgi:hypothetical protein